MELAKPLEILAFGKAEDPVPGNDCRLFARPLH